MDKETREFLDRKFNAIDEKFSRVDERFSGIDEKFEETKQHFGVIAEGIRNEIRQVAEGVINVDEKLERFRQEVREEFKEIKAMIKFSYAELIAVYEPSRRRCSLLKLEWSGWRPGKAITLKC